MHTCHFETPSRDDPYADIVSAILFLCIPLEIISINVHAMILTYSTIHSGCIFTIAPSWASYSMGRYAQHPLRLLQRGHERTGDDSSFYLCTPWPCRPSTPTIRFRCRPLQFGFWEGPMPHGKMQESQCPIIYLCCYFLASCHFWTCHAIAPFPCHATTEATMVFIH